MIKLKIAHIFNNNYARLAMQVNSELNKVFLLFSFSVILGSDTIAYHNLP